MSRKLGEFQLFVKGTSKYVKYNEGDIVTYRNSLWVAGPNVAMGRTPADQISGWKKSKAGDLTGIAITADAGLTGTKWTRSGSHYQHITVATGGITTAHIADNAITSSKIADGAILGVDVATGVTLTNPDITGDMELFGTMRIKATAAGYHIGTISAPVFHVGGDQRQVAIEASGGISGGSTHSGAGTLFAPIFHGLTGVFDKGISCGGDIVLQNGEYISNPSAYTVRMMPEGTSATDYGLEFEFSDWGYGSVITNRKASDLSNAGSIKFDSPVVINQDKDLSFGSNAHSRMRWTMTGNNTLQIGVKSNDDNDDCSGAVALIHSSHFAIASRSPGVTHTNPNLYVYAYNTNANNYIRFEHDGTNANIVTGVGDISLQPASGVVEVTGLSAGGISTDNIHVKSGISAGGISTDNIHAKSGISADLVKGYTGDFWSVIALKGISSAGNIDLWHTGLGSPPNLVCHEATGVSAGLGTIFGLTGAFNNIVLTQGLSAQDGLIEGNTGEFNQVVAVSGISCGGNITVRNSGDVALNLIADTDNSGENDNPIIAMGQDGAEGSFTLGIVGDSGQIFTNSLSNACFLNTKTTYNDLQFAVDDKMAMTILDTGEVGIGTNAPAASLDVSGNIFASAGISANASIISGNTAEFVDIISVKGLSAQGGLIDGKTGNFNEVVAVSGISTGGPVRCQDQDVVRPNLKDYSESTNAISWTAPTDIDFEDGNVQTLTVALAGQTVQFSNPPASGKAGTVTLIITNGGSQTLTWPAAVKWPGDNAPALTSSGVDIVSFITIDAGTTIYGFVGGINFS